MDTPFPLHGGYVEEGLRDKVPLSPTQYVYIHSKFCLHH